MTDETREQLALSFRDAVGIAVPRIVDHTWKWAQRQYRPFEEDMVMAWDDRRVIRRHLTRWLACLLVFARHDYGMWFGHEVYWRIVGAAILRPLVTRLTPGLRFLARMELPSARRLAASLRKRPATGDYFMWKLTNSDDDDIWCVRSTWTCVTPGAERIVYLSIKL